MFNFKKIGKKVLSSVLGATLAMGGFLNTQIVKAEEIDREQYWDPYTMLSLAGFILGEDKKEGIKELKERFEKELNTKLSNENLSDLSLLDRQKKVLEIENNLAVATNGWKSQLENKLDEKGKIVYNAVKECITDEKADFGKLSSIGESSEIKDVVLNNDLQCKIAKFENKTQKAIVGVSVSAKKKFKNSHMKKIIYALKELRIEEVENNDFKNVYLVIRSKENGGTFYIGDVMKELKNATVVTPEAIFDGSITISGEILDGSVTISENSTLVANGVAAFLDAVTVNGNLTANGAAFFNAVTVNGNFTANRAEFSYDVTVNGNNLTVDIRNARFEYFKNSEYYIICTINAQNSKIDLTGCDFNKIKFRKNCKNLEITIGEYEGGKFYHKYKNIGLNVFATINGLEWEKFKKEQEEIERKRKEQEEQKQDNKDNGFNNNENNEDNKYENQNNGNTKQNRENKTWKTFKRVGITGLIGLSVVASIIAFKDKIKSIFGKNQNKKPVAKKIKTSY